MMTTETQTEKKYPTHTVFYTTEKSDGNKKNWNRTGAIWVSEEGDKISISLNIFGQKISLVGFKYEPRQN